LKINQSRDSYRPCGPHDVARAEHVGTDVLGPAVGIFIGRRRMDDPLGLEIAKCLLDELFVRNGSFDNGQVRVGWQVLAAPGGEVVEDEHRVAPRQQAVGQIGSDKAGSAGNENFHCFDSLRFSASMDYGYRLKVYLLAIE